MASPLLDIRVQGSERVESLVRTLTSEGTLRNILDEGAAVLFGRMRARFLAQTDPDGVKWKASPAALRREKSGRGGGILFSTGRLFHSLQLYADSSLSRAIGTDVPYGKFHQYGSIRLPKRQFLGFSDGDVETMEAVAIRRIAEALR